MEKKKVTRKKGIRSIFVIGEKTKTRPKQRAVCNIISLAAIEVWESLKDAGYIIVGNTRPIEEAVVSACKILGIRILQQPANFSMYSGASAEQMRNADMIQTFKPEMVVIFSKVPAKEIEDSVLQHVISIARKKNIPLKVVS